MTVFCLVKFMELKLNETSVICGSSESDHKMAVFWDLMTRDQLTTVMMEAADSSEALVNMYQRT